MARTVGSAADDTRQRIVTIATELFVEHGFAGTSIRDITERLGMTKGSVYYHFSSKEDLLAALMAPLFEAMDRFAAAARSRGQVTHELIRSLVDVLDQHGPMLRALIADPSVERAKLEQEHGMPDRFIELLRILGGSPEPAAMLRARCALGVIHAGVLAPGFERCPPGAGPGSSSSGGGSVGAGSVPPHGRLSEAAKTFVTDAAMAVLSVPMP
jgi:AcrR family transcriptional regulator